MVKLSPDDHALRSAPCSPPAAKSSLHRVAGHGRHAPRVHRHGAKAHRPGIYTTILKVTVLLS